MATLIFDAQPLVAYALNEPVANLVEARLRAIGPGDEGLITAVNWCELLYVVRRALGAHAAARTAYLLEAAGLSVVEATSELAAFAAEVKALHGVGLGDSFAAALALATGSPLLTADSDFLPLAEFGLRLDWLGDAS